MRHFAVIGSPIEHSLSPILHNWVFKSLHIRAEYQKIKVSINDIPDIIMKIREGKLDGINVTIPYKETVIPYLDECDPLAEKIQAVNTIVNDGGRLKGYNTDGLGFVWALKEECGISPANQSVLIIGAGGSAKAIAHALCDHGISQLCILNRTLERAEALASQLHTHYKVPVSVESDEHTAFSKHPTIVIQTRNSL